MSLPDGDVREDWGAGPTGDRAFVVLAIDHTDEQGLPSSRFDGVREIERVRTGLLDTWSFEAYGNNAYAFALFASLVLQSEAAQSMLRGLKAGMVSMGSVTDLTGLAGSQEERARFTFVLSTDRIIETTQYRIDRANIDVHYTTLDDQLRIERVEVEPESET